MESRPDIDTYFINITKIVATRATCLRRSVGCVLADAHGHVLSTGYNGRHAGAPHCNELKVQEFISTTDRNEVLALFEDSKTLVRSCNWPKNVPLTDDPNPAIEIFPNACLGAVAPSGADLDMCEAIHAEQNALLQCHDVYQIETCYVTTFSCLTCVKLLLNTACQRIVYVDSYGAHGSASLELWTKSGRAAVFNAGSQAG